MSQLELGAFIHTHLRGKGINVVLSGGMCVSFYSHNKYISKDMDLINIHFTERKLIRAAMDMIGFFEEGMYFKHPDTKYIVEFPQGPLSIGEESVQQIIEVMFSTGSLRLLSPTDCVKDRLVAYYHWNDKQCLFQAELVTLENDVDIEEIRRWSTEEGHLEKFNEIYFKLVRKPATK
jgi:hypothetical protein